MVATSHIREMLGQARELAEAAEISDGVLERQRMLQGAAVLARHAAAELDDEAHRDRYPAGYDR